MRLANRETSRGSRRCVLACTCLVLVGVSGRADARLLKKGLQALRARSRRSRAAGVLDATAREVTALQALEQKVRAERYAVVGEGQHVSVAGKPRKIPLRKRQKGLRIGLPGIGGFQVDIGPARIVAGGYERDARVVSTGRANRQIPLHLTLRSGESVYVAGPSHTEVIPRDETRLALATAVIVAGIEEAVTSSTSSDGSSSAQGGPRVSAHYNAIGPGMTTYREKRRNRVQLVGERRKTAKLELIEQGLALAEEIEQLALSDRPDDRQRASGMLERLRQQTDLATAAYAADNAELHAQRIAWHERGAADRVWHEQHHYKETADPFPEDWRSLLDATDLPPHAGRNRQDP